MKCKICLKNCTPHELVGVCFICMKKEYEKAGKELKKN